MIETILIAAIRAALEGLEALRANDDEARRRALLALARHASDASMLAALRPEERP